MLFRPPVGFGKSWACSIWAPVCESSPPSSSSRSNLATTTTTTATTKNLGAASKWWIRISKLARLARSQKRPPVDADACKCYQKWVTWFSWTNHYERTNQTTSTSITTAKFNIYHSKFKLGELLLPLPLHIFLKLLSRRIEFEIFELSSWKLRQTLEF